MWCSTATSIFTNASNRRRGLPISSLEQAGNCARGTWNEWTRWRPHSTRIVPSRWWKLPARKCTSSRSARQAKWLTQAWSPMRRTRKKRLRPLRPQPHPSGSSRLPRRQDEANNLVHPDAVGHLREQERAVPAHLPRVAIHHAEIRAYQRSEIGFVYHQQIRLRDSRPALARD